MVKNVLIIEDEVAGINVLMNAINEFAIGKLKVIGFADSVESAKIILAQHKVDIAFMDIVLKDGTSFDLLDQLQEIPFKIVFVTAYDKYAVEAFRFSALDYLLKPLDSEIFSELIDRLQHDNFLSEQANQVELFKSIRKSNIIERVNKIALATEYEIEFESLDNIQYFQAQQNYTLIFTASGKKYTMAKNLGYYDNLLENHSNFFRAHHSTIININFIKKITKTNASTTFQVHFENDLNFTISQRRLGEFKKLLQL